MEKIYIFKYLSIQILTFKKNIYSQDFVKPILTNIAFLFKMTDIFYLN